MNVEEWEEKARSLYGPDKLKWKFVCPSCGHVASVQDWKDVGATEGEVAFSCVGRHIEGSASIGGRPGPCNYTGGGLFALNPVTIELPDRKIAKLFNFADSE